MPTWQGSVTVPLFNTTSSPIVTSFQAVAGSTEGNTVSVTVIPLSMVSCQNVPSGYVLYNSITYKLSVTEQPSNIYQLIGLIGASAVVSPVPLPANGDFVSIIPPLDMQLNYNSQCYSYLNGDIPIAFGNTENNNQVWFLFPESMEYLGYFDMSQSAVPVTGTKSNIVTVTVAGT